MIKNEKHFWGWWTNALRSWFESKIGSPAAGQPSTLFEAIAASGGYTLLTNSEVEDIVDDSNADTGSATDAAAIIIALNNSQGFVTAVRNSSGDTDLGFPVYCYSYESTDYYVATDPATYNATVYIEDDHEPIAIGTVAEVMING